MKIKVPGKLFILGEYNVLNSNHSAVVMAVNRFMFLDFQETEHFSIRSRYGNTLEELPHAKAAYEICRDYFSFLQVPFPTYRISIKSELDSGDKKLGLGSSGAVIVGLIQGYLRALDIDDPLLILKLCILADLKMEKAGSAADMAAMIYGGVIGYQRYDLEWLLNEKDNLAILDQEWPGLVIVNDIEIPRFIVGWTQSAHQTNFKKIDVPNSVYLQADSIVKEAIDKRYVSLLDIHAYQVWMDKFEDLTGRKIRTKTLSQLINIAELCGGVGKISGAGGGDCGLLFQVMEIDKCHELLNDSGIVALNVGVYEND